MRPFRIVAVLLVVLGVVVLVWGEIPYQSRKESMQIGPLEATVETESLVPIPRALGGIAVAAGVLLLWMDRKQRGR